MSVPSKHVATSSARGLPPTARGRLLRRERGHIIALAARHGASDVRLFGSTARGEDRPDSDIDLLVKLGPRVGLFGLLHLQGDLCRLLGVPVDVIPEDGLKPRVRASMEPDLIAL